MLVLADAETLRERAADRYVGELVRQQLLEADLVLLNKTDLVADAALPPLCDWLASVAPARAGAALPAGASAARTAVGRRHQRPLSRDAAPPLSTRAAVRQPEPGFRACRRHAALAAPLAAPPLRLLRAKGLMRDRDGQPRSLQLVGARRALAPSAHAQPRSGRLVCIALRGELQADRIRAALAACAA